MPVFAYQSLNSGVQSDHGVAASNSQRFTKSTHNNIAKSDKPWMLSMPVAQGVAPDVPVHGPAQLLPTAKDIYKKQGRFTDKVFLNLVEGKARQIHQHLIRSLGQCSVLVYGELDGNHREWQSMQQHAGNLLTATSTGKACNSFSVHTNGSGSHRFIQAGMGWIAVESDGIRALFVHVPNSVATNKSLTKKFYSDIHTRVLQSEGGGVIDVIMGDTNQPNPGYTQNVASDALGQSFAEFHQGKEIQPEDAYQRSFGGTNSNARKKYDVAVYNTATVRIENLIYLSQCVDVAEGSGSAAAAITDHMGIGIKIARV